MAGKHSASSSSLERRPVVVSSGSSAGELSIPGPSDPQSVPLGQVSSSSSLSSYTVPVRLDVLYFLLNSAAKGAQNAQPLMPAQGGHGPFSAWLTPPTQYAANCCCCGRCHSVAHCASVEQPSGVHHFGAGHGGHGGRNADVPESQNNGHRWVSTAQPRDGKAWSGSSQPSPVGGRQRAQSPTGWKENRRGEGGHKSSNGQGWGPNTGRAWRDQRQGSAESYSWKSGQQGWRREESSFSSNSGNGKRNQKGSCWQMLQDAPEAKRGSFSSGLGRQKSQGMKESTSFIDKAAGTELTKAAVPDDAEDWETDYENRQAVSSAPGSIPHSSHQEDQTDSSKAGVDGEDKCASSNDLPKLRLVSFPLPGMTSKDRSVPAGGKEPTTSHADQSRNGGSVSCLKSLSSDLPGKSSSEALQELAIDTVMELSKSEEEWWPKDATILGGDQDHPISCEASKEDI